jgi:hypothetical protein
MAEFGSVGSPSGDRLLYVCEQPGWDVCERSADGTRPPETLISSGEDKIPQSLSPDGSALFFVMGTPGQIWTRDMQTGALAQLDIPSPSYSPAVSPDGRWLAYNGLQSGLREVYLVSYPDPTKRRIQVSTGGGEQPTWTRGGRELVFRNGTALMAVTVDPVSGELGEPALLFDGQYPPAGFGGGGLRTYDAAADGSRFVMVKRPEQTEPQRIRFVMNFFEELRRLAPPSP